MAESEKKLVVVFKTTAVKDEGASAKAGRPIYKDMEVCEIRSPGDRLMVKVFPAHSFAGWYRDENGDQTQQTYAMKYQAQYLRFKNGKQQVQEGTPLEELPFLTQAKRMELKALNVYTAESLASLDGQPLKALGMGGRDLKNQAQAYIDNATGSAAVTKLATENASLREQMENMQREIAEMRKPAEPIVTEALDILDDEALKELIKEQTGARPRGTPSRETLLRMAQESQAA